VAAGTAATTAVRTKPAEKVVIALTGFVDDEVDGERSTMMQMIEQLLGTIRQHRRDRDRGARSRDQDRERRAVRLNGAQRDCGWYIDPLECSVMLQTNHDDFSPHSCTHVIVSDQNKK
jgi:hypothetical protein